MRFAVLDGIEPVIESDGHERIEQGLSEASEYLATLSPDTAGAPWRLTLGGSEVFSMPRVVMRRNLLLNHWYHHRGQLSVYLRLLDVPVPVIYGCGADENPFA